MVKDIHLKLLRPQFTMDLKLIVYENTRVQKATFETQKILLGHILFLQITSKKWHNTLYACTKFKEKSIFKANYS